MAWLSTPQEQGEDIRANLIKPNSKEATPEEVGQFQYLIDLLIEIGPTLNREVLPWSEIQAYQKASGVTLCGWEARTIRKLSLTFSNSVKKYDGQRVPCPIYTQPGMRQPIGKDKIRATLRTAAPQ